MDISTLDKRKLVKIGLAIGIPLLIIVGLLNAPSIVTIEADGGATISTTKDKDGAFKTIGAGTVTHLFWGKPTSLFVSAQQGNQQTITSLQLQRLRKQSLHIDLSSTVPAKKVTDGGVIDAIFNGDEGRGIVAGQDTLVNFNTKIANQPPDPALVTLPYIRKVIWRDFNNFIYLADDGVGQFFNGGDKGFGNVGTSISGDVNITTTNDSGNPLIIDMSQAKNRPLVLLSSTNIFTADDSASKWRAISSFDVSKRDTRVFASDSGLFKVQAPLLTESDSKIEVTDEQQKMTVQKLSYSGKVLRTTSIDDNAQVIDVIEHDGDTYVLTQGGLNIISPDSTLRKKALYFNDPAGMVVYKGKVLVLANQGLWQIADNGSFQLLFKFSGLGSGLDGSLTIDPNNRLTFGTKPNQTGPAKSATFSLSF